LRQQIGTREIEEIDAMRTIGVRLIEVLVVPPCWRRLRMPLLCFFFAMLTGIIGGGILLAQPQTQAIRHLCHADQRSGADP
jgi:ABC-type transporter Mla maintaining outer membrane lipid asymmetry permease subunit MlaE